MPSNKDLQDEIAVTSTKLGVEPDLSGNNVQLAERLKELRQALADAENVKAEPPAPKVPEADASAQATADAAMRLDQALKDLAAKPSEVEKPAIEPELTPKVPEVEKPAVVVEVVPAAVSYVVAKGRSVTTLRGIKADGMKIAERDFKRAEDFQHQIKRGVIVEEKPAK